MGKGIKIKAPKITVGKDLGVKNLGKAASAIAKNAGSVGSQIVKTAGKGAEGLVGNTADIAGAIAKGDFKGIGKEGLELLQSGKDIAKGLSKAGLTAGTGTLGATGQLTGSKDIVKASENIQREGTKGVNTYGDAAIDVAANVGTGGTYGLAKQAASSLSSGGLGGLVSGKGLQEAALSAAGSYAGVDPNLMKMGMSAAKGDLKGAALSGLGSFGGVDPNMLKMGASALTGDKGGLASGLASQFGAGDSAANMLGSAVKGDVKGALLGKLAGATGLDPKLLNNLSSGKIDPMQLAGAAGLDTKKLLGGATDKLGISSLTSSPEAQEIMDMGRSAGRNVASIEKNIQAAKETAEGTYKIAKGDTLAAIAKKMGVDPAALAAANNIKDPNKIAAGMQLKLPEAMRSPASTVEGARKNITDKYLKDANGKTIYGPNNAPIKNPDYDVEAADKLAIEQQSGQAAPGEEWTLDRVIGNVKREAGNVVDKVKGAGSAAASFVKDNPNLTEGLIQGAGAAAGYAATSSSAKEQQEILKRQEKEAQQIREMEKFQYDPRRAQAYDQSYGFQQERIAQGGFTAAEAAQQKADDLRSAKMRQAARMAGLQSLAAKGQGSTGSGAAFAEMLSGMQEASDIGAQQDIARQRQASENLEKSYAVLPEMMERKSQSEMDLAQRRSAEDISRTSQLGDVRESQRSIEADRGRALATLAGAATDTASNLVKNYVTDAKEATPQPTTPQATPTRTPASTQVKAAGAAQVAGNKPIPTTKSNSEMATGQLGSGAGVLATPNADALNQKYSMAPQPKSGVEQLLGGDLLKQGQQMLSKAPAPVQQTVNKAVDKGKEAVNKLTSQFGLKF